MTYGATVAEFSHIQEDAVLRPSERVQDFVGPESPDFIGPRDATDVSRGIVNSKIRDVAEIALRNFIKFPEYYELLKLNVQSEVEMGLLRLNSTHPGLSADQQVQKFVEESVETERLKIDDKHTIEAKLRQEFDVERAAYQARIAQLTAKQVEASKQSLVLTEEVRNLDIPQDQIIAILDKVYTGQNGTQPERISQPEQQRHKSRLRAYGSRLLQFIPTHFPDAGRV